MTFTTTKLEIMMTLFWKNLECTKHAYFYKETFLIILKIYNCLKLPFNVTILQYCYLVSFLIFVITGPPLIAVFFLKLRQQSSINMFELLLLLLLLIG